MLGDSLPCTAYVSHPCEQDFYTQADAAKAAKGFSNSSEPPAGLAGAVKSVKRTVVLVGGALLGLLILYVMWPSGGSYGYDGVEETEHFVTVSGTQVCFSLPAVVPSRSQ